MNIYNYLPTQCISVLGIPGQFCSLMQLLFQNYLIICIHWNIFNVNITEYAAFMHWLYDLYKRHHNQCK